MAVKIGNREELKAWLDLQPREVSVAIAARAALRVLPMIETEKRTTDFRRAIVLPIFRATAVAWATVKYPAQATAFAAADAADAAYADAAAAYAAAAYAADARAADARAAYAAAAYAAAAAAADAHAAGYAAATRAADAHAAAYADAAAAAAAAAARAADAAAFWSAISADAEEIDTGATASSLAGAPLWPNSSAWAHYGVPDELWSLWQEMKAALHAANEDWQVWTGWYEDRLAGGVRADARELAYSHIENELWNQGPAAVNTDIKCRIEPDDPPERAPDIPPQRPAALEPIWEKGKLVLPPGPVRTDGDVESLSAALNVLRAEMIVLADDAEGEANIDRRCIAYLRQTAALISDDLPRHEELFRLAHRNDGFVTYAATVEEQWPDFLAGRYNSLTRHFDRTVRQSPKWREFVRNAVDTQLSPEQANRISALANKIVVGLRDEDARKFAHPALPDSLNRLQEPLQPAAGGNANLSPLADDSAKVRLAEDVLESINNTLKRAVERILETAKEMGSGFAGEFRRSFVTESEEPDNEIAPAVRKWLIGVVFGGGLAAGLIAAAPHAFNWLEAIKPFLILH